MNDGLPTAGECEKKAAELGFDLTKQFLTLAFAGIAFVVGLSFSTPGAVSLVMLWLVIGAFGLSAVLGLFFLMHGVNLLSIQKTYDIYASSLRLLATSQIVFMLIGAGLLVPILEARYSKKAPPVSNSVEIRLGPQQSVVYPIDPSKSITIELDGGKVKITSSKETLLQGER
ncbi:MAG: hypothetical protein ACLPPV_03655 [Candidatus Korobacteraceae bacterium]|jgi:membrane-bound ClpP family serine protease